MAIGVMNWVWDHSRSRHGGRLVLLAIADCASGDGANAWPSVAELKRKSGLAERAVQTALADLVKLGELEIGYNAGPKGCNRYRVVMATPMPPADTAPPQNLHPANSAPPQDLRGLASPQVNAQNPADTAPPANSAPPQISTGTPAESAPGTVLEPSKDSSSKSPSSRRRTATRIPDDFIVTDEMAQWARGNVPELIRLGRGKRETDKFLNHWRSKGGKDATKLDWSATWRNWMLNADERLPSQAAGATNPKQQVTDELFERAAQRIASRKESA